VLTAGIGVWRAHESSSQRNREVLQHAGKALAWADSIERALNARRPSEITTSEAVAALYLERLRLGLGSPFRIIDQALRDQALAPVGSIRLADALLARTLTGEAYRSHGHALDLLSTDPRLVGSGVGTEHERLIDSIVASWDDPRIGELSVRLAYRLASASGAVSHRAPELAIAAAAQARDRVLAMRDARALLETAARDGVSPFALMRLWRETRRFDVERPVIVPLSAKAERSAVADLPQLVSTIEGLQVEQFQASSTAGTRRSDALPTRMATMASARDLPPMSPVIVAVRAYSSSRELTSRSDELAHRRFVGRVTNEEKLAAEYALLRSHASRAIAEADAVIMTAGVALRSFAQERAWVRGESGPTARELQSRYGVSVTHDSTNATSWRPYLHRSLEQAIIDMRRVLPGFDPRGLRVHFGASPMGDRALALHDPTRRTIFLPPASGSGVMAHEFAHDLDWQAARREYGGTGWYRSDHAFRRSLDRLAGPLRQMASASRVDTTRERRGGPSRPTELLARNVDWFVSASLARDGRLNGHLSAVQDPVLIGYGSAIAPDAASDGGGATLRALDGLTSLTLATRNWYSDLYGEGRKVTVHDAVRRVLELPMGRVGLEPPQWSFTPWQLDAPSSGRGSWTCRLDDLTERATDADAVRAAVQYAAESRARGIVKQWADFARRQPDATPSRLRALTGAPWDPGLKEATLREIRDAILVNALAPRPSAGQANWVTRTPAPGC
jgi:hypothetical protein